MRDLGREVDHDEDILERRVARTRGQDAADHFARMRSSDRQQPLSFYGEAMKARDGAGGGNRTHTPLGTGF